MVITLNKEIVEETLIMPKNKIEKFTGKPYANPCKISEKKDKNVSREELRNFIVKTTGRDDRLISYKKLEKKFGKKQAYGFHQRGLIYEPIHGKAKLI